MFLESSDTSAVDLLRTTPELTGALVVEWGNSGIRRKSKGPL